jgi:peptide/nickel transport system permease protein
MEWQVRLRNAARWLSRFFRGAPKVPLMCLTGAILCAIFAPVLAPYDPVAADTSNILAPPSYSHPLGTDYLGRDVLSRLIFGARISVTVGFLAVVVSGTVGTVIAVTAGVLKGYWDSVLMRITDAALAVPFLMIAVTVLAIVGPGIVNVILVIGLLRWMSYARVLRSQVITITEMDYVRLAVVAGAGKPRIIWRHALPNLVNSLVVLGTLELGTAVIYESTLSFLGLGVPRPMPSWGSMLIESQAYLFTAWWLPLFPGLAVFILVMASNLMGDWLRDRLDPRRRQVYG